MSDTLTHLDENGAARMVDVSQKEITYRKATASARVSIQPATSKLLLDQELPKGDAIAVARIAGIMAAKRTPELIPLCHPLAISQVNVDIEVLADCIEILATVTVNSRTGVEMEAMTAAAVAGLTIYDMVKGVDREAFLENVRLEEKSGGKSGHFRRMS
ncbi:MAG: cyclic pyranopterin monophosphate synthase MoaC [Chthonomonadales bacterium]